MKPKILFVLTSHSQLGSTGRHTGYYLPEAAHPWHVLNELGYTIDFISPQGGEPPMDGRDLTDPINRAFIESPAVQAQLKATRTPEQINLADYAAIFFAGGHGTMWDLPDHPTLQRYIREMHERGGVVAAVCHGTVALINVRLSSGQLLVEGRRINGFTDDEERSVKLEHVVPFLLETRLIELGARFQKSDPWQANVTVDSRIITGQNPASASGVGLAIHQVLEAQAKAAAGAAASPKAAN